MTYAWSFTSKPDESKASLSDPTVPEPSFTPDVAGTYVVQLIVYDSKEYSAPDTVTISVQAAPVTVTVPNVVGMSQSAAKSAITGAGLTVGTVTEAASQTVPAGAVLSQNPAAGASVTRGSAVNLVVSSGPTGGGEWPPDPKDVAPTVDPTVATTTYAATAFLYTGSDPIQTGVAAGTIEPKRAAVLRGKVLDKANQPLPGVTLTILNHPEFGQTLSRDDGMFDLAVNGGGYLTLNYQRNGYLPAQRPVNVPWQDFLTAPDVVLITADPQVSTVDLTASSYSGRAGERGERCERVTAGNRVDSARNHGASL